MRIGRHLTYANVLATLTLFLVLGGGAAIAAGKLGKNSVGAPQLKKNAVTTAKIKKNAVTSAKIGKGAISAAKIKAGSLEGSDLSPALPYSKIVHTARGNASVPVPESGVVYPLEGTTFTQEAGVALTVLGGLEISVGSGCKGPEVFAAIVLDQADPLKALTEPVSLQGRGVIAEGELETEAPGPFTRRLTVHPELFGTPFGVAPAAATQHSLALAVGAECASGSGVTATFGGIDVIASGKVSGS